MRKLEGGMWDSKFILPEHRARMEREKQEGQRREKPALDQQELEEIDRALFYSLNDGVPVTLRLWDPFPPDRIAKGYVLDVNRSLRRIKLRWSEDDWDWIDMDEIMSANT
ncbi:YolD-like family protein [Paenibacillus sp. HN-1]|uniref:YolD-like family protein n=1 Tax=Paenibacillus TaxID=44249 RepID=UPI001CA862B8|nr:MULTISPECIES: YolD-like family protein [Paenibacillus]MBY9077083.1 YolD-like family protein [Paenibacillus sp. CGMCC 1.18879]MBY9086544.1 YolD-like family protein [Paenibacillus sinensis]